MCVTIYPGECVKREALNMVTLHASPPTLLLLFNLDDLNTAVRATFWADLMRSLGSTALFTAHKLFGFQCPLAAAIGPASS